MVRVSNVSRETYHAMDKGEKKMNKTKIAKIDFVNKSELGFYKIEEAYEYGAKGMFANDLEVDYDELSIKRLAIEKIGDDLAEEIRYYHIIYTPHDAPSVHWHYIAQCFVTWGETVRNYYRQL